MIFLTWPYLRDKEVGAKPVVGAKGNCLQWSTLTLRNLESVIVPPAFSITSITCNSVTSNQNCISPQFSEVCTSTAQLGFRCRQSPVLWRFQRAGLAISPSSSASFQMPCVRIRPCRPGFEGVTMIDSVQNKKEVSNSVAFV